MQSRVYNARPPPSPSYHPHSTGALRVQPAQHTASLAQCHCANCTSCVSDASTSSSLSGRPRKSRRLKYTADCGVDLSAVGHRSHVTGHSPRTPNSLHRVPPTPPSSRGSDRLSKSRQSESRNGSWASDPSFSEPRGWAGAPQQLSSSRAAVSKTGSWCSTSPTRNQMIPDFVLFDDDVDEGGLWRNSPRCPSPPMDRFATPGLTPLCTDLEFCSCCAHEKMVSWGCRSQRRTKLESQVEDAMSYIAGVKSRHLNIVD